MCETKTRMIAYTTLCPEVVVFKGRVHKFLTHQVWMSPMLGSTVIQVLKEIIEVKFFTLALAAHSIIDDAMRAFFTFTKCYIKSQIQQQFFDARNVRHIEHENFHVLYDGYFFYIKRILLLYIKSPTGKDMIKSDSCSFMVVR